MSGRSGWIAAAIVAVVVGAGVAAVTQGGDSDGGKGGKKGDDVTLIANSVDAAADAGSARFTFNMEMEGMPQGSVQFTGEGEMDLAGDAARMTMDFGDMPGLGQFQIEMVATGTVVYMKMPPAMAAQLGNKPWMSMNLEELAEMEGVDLGSLGGGMGSNDPTELLDFLRGASNQVQTIGHETVRGVQTTHYRATVDIRRALEQAPGADRDAIRATFDQYEAMGAPTVFPADVWIDSDGLPRRFVMRMNMSSIPDAPENASIVLTMEMFDYGVDVSVEPPPAGEVTDMTEMIKNQQDPFAA